MLQHNKTNATPSHVSGEALAAGEYCADLPRASALSLAHDEAACDELLASLAEALDAEVVQAS